MKRSMFYIIALLSLLWARAPLAAQEGGPQRAGLVIVGAEGEAATAATYCVAFEEALTGLELLERADVGVEVGVSGGGAMVCAINAQGCPASDCFCECKGAPCRYWTYFHRAADGSWAYSGVGAQAWTLRDGDLDAWVWGDGSAQPPALAFADACPSAAGTPIPTPAALPPAAVETPLPTPTAPEYRIVIPIPPPAQPEPGHSWLSWLPPALIPYVERYGSFVLLLLTVVGYALLKRRRAPR